MVFTDDIMHYMTYLLHLIWYLKSIELCKFNFLLAEGVIVHGSNCSRQVLVNVPVLFYVRRRFDIA